MKPALRLLPALPRVSVYDELRAELICARAERVAHANRLRQSLRAAMRYLAAGRPGIVGQLLDEMADAVEQEDLRARHMDVPSADPDGIVAAGHGAAA